MSRQQVKAPKHTVRLLGLSTKQRHSSRCEGQARATHSIQAETFTAERTFTVRDLLCEHIGGGEGHVGGVWIADHLLGAAAVHLADIAHRARVEDRGCITVAGCIDSLDEGI